MKLPFEFAIFLRKVWFNLQNLKFAIRFLVNNITKLEKIKDDLIASGKVIPANFDPVFKIVMLDCPNYLAFLVSSFTNIPKERIKKRIRVQNNEHKLSNAKERKKTSDLIIRVDKMLANFEMNNRYFDGLFIRNEAYLGKIEGESLNVSEDYSNMNSFLQVNLNNFSHFKVKSPILKFYYADMKNRIIETGKVKKYHISLPKLKKKYYNGDKLTKLEKALLILSIDKIKDLDEISKGDDDLMEAAKRIKEATFDINTIGLYDAEERRRQEDAMYLAYREKIATRRGYCNGRKAGIEQGIQEGLQQGIQEGLQQGISQGISQGIEQERNTIINAMLSKGLSYDTISEITNIPNQEIKRMRK